MLFYQSQRTLFGNTPLPWLRMPANLCLQDFHPIVRGWFEKTFGEPSPPQVLGWPSISAGKHTLILAPTGSGKTLAAFLWAINHVTEQHIHERLTPGIRILYISPLKALNNDVERNLQKPLTGIREEAQRQGVKLPLLRTAVRTGDTPQSKRTAMVKHPPDILITTPESLYLMLTSKQARKTFTTVQYVIVDEIHSLCGNKRGTHLSLSLERLGIIAEQEFIRIGLSATQRPLDQIASFLGGFKKEGNILTAREVQVFDAGRKKQMDLRVECVVPDFSVMPQESIWPMLFTELLEQIRTHNTTLIFVNNRRLAERVATKLNELIAGQKDTFNLYAVPLSGPALPHQSDIPAKANVEAVRAYHGSMSRHSREQMESDLKAGKLRVLVATSSLELGIDIGSIDLVVQLQSPKGVSRGLQRVGRSGHLVTATSKGRIYPTYREDLVEAAVVAHSMAAHEVEYTAIPRNCLDVLAQQIVAMVSVEEWDVDNLFETLLQSYSFNSLPKKLYLGVLNMLAGRYNDQAFRELRARISWDKVNNTLRALPGSSQLAIISGGTITDRGYFGVYLEDGKTKVGEVDEEFILESRVGDTFILGTNIWRMQNIDASKITVAPAPGQPARMPFWRGEGIGRSRELGTAVGNFRLEMQQRLDSPGLLSWLQQEYPIDQRSAWNIQEYFRRQRDITGTIPNNKLILIEGFRDEIGDPRIVVHSSFGRRVNGLLGLVLSRRLQDRISTEPQMLYNDDGVLLRCSAVESLPLDFFNDINVHEAEAIVLDEIFYSPLFGGQFRQNAARALLMPKVAPGKRTPLWLQRLRAADLLHIARKFDDFPIVIETLREILHDVLDFEQFKEIIGEIGNGSIQVRTAQTEIPSPFAAGLLFEFIGVYMYEWDQPRTDKLSRYLSVNRELLSEIVDLDSLSSMLKPEAIELVEKQLQRTHDGYKARSPEELLEFLLHIGDLSSEEIAARTVDGSSTLIQELAANGRAVQIRIGTQVRWIAGEEAGLYRELTSGNSAAHVVRRYLQNHGPVTSQQLATRFGFKRDMVETVLQKLSITESLVKGTFRERHGENPGQAEWCYRPSLEKIHRATISILRKEISPCSLLQFTEFLFQWQHIAASSRLSGPRGIQECLEQLAGIALQSDSWEREIFYRRIRSYTSEQFQQLTASGEIVWVGAGSGKLKPVFRGEGGIFLATLDELAPALSRPAQKVLEYLQHHGASFFSDIRSGTGLSLHALNNGIAELFWNTTITNDIWNEIINIKRPSKKESGLPLEPVHILDPHHNPGRAKLMHSARRALRQVPGWNGRWSLVQSPGVMGAPTTLEQRVANQCNILLYRYGIVAREVCRREDLLPWSVLAGHFHTMELRGEIRRGYFVEGLSGMQFALPEAVEQLRSLIAMPDKTHEMVMINSCDPANPYGPGVEISGTTIRLSRLTGNHIFFVSGSPVLIFENFGARLWTIGEQHQDTFETALRQFIGMAKLPDSLRPFKSVTIETINDARPVGSIFERTLKRIGFLRYKNQTMRYDGYM